MKLLRYGEVGAEKPGMLDDQGGIRDLSSIVDDISPATIEAGELDGLKSVDPTGLPRVEGNPRLGPCVGRIGKFVCIGLNYSDHAKETGMPIPTEPIVFMKTTSSISGPDDDIELIRGSVKTDWEVELGVVMGAHTKYVSEEDALNHVAGYCIVNDVSERQWQLEQGGRGLGRVLRTRRRPGRGWTGTPAGHRRHRKRPSSPGGSHDQTHGHTRPS